MLFFRFIFINGLLRCKQYTAMHWAAKKGRRDVVEALGGTGIDVNEKTRGGYTALHLAVIQGNEEVISMLVDNYDADIHIRDNSGYKAKHYLRPDASLWAQRKLGKKIAPPRSPIRSSGKNERDMEHISSLLVQMQTLSSSLGSGVDLIGLDMPVTPPTPRKLRSSSFVKILKGKSSKKEKDTKLEVPDEPPSEPEMRYRTGRARSAPNINQISNWTPRVFLVPP
ncbi:ankyrin repeat domain-containing protein SOWAHA isoform X2 [Nematostella vectensis]|uniref:ankyrin repeat domain-containing protein SOWAHA isoform X2 n=1 Tax=Nematostella vectensis TaxID=45351 RepID=UPI00139019E5|nr:ankyrin repeat domain-containing protein SOWAHA isoform X2 [Nematostella vectensis]